MWDAHYSEHIQRYQFAAERLPPGAVVLDAGCGCGYGSAFLADRGAARVVAVDVDREALAMARSQFSRDRITYLEEDCQVLDEATRQGPFHFICNFDNLEHLPHPERFLRRAAQCLRPDGTLIVSTPNRIAMNRLRGVARDSPSVNPFHFREFSAQELREFLGTRFREIVLHYQVLEPALRMHFEPALVQLWHNPAVRMGRLAQRWLRRRRPVVESIEELLPPRAYQILATDPGAETSITLIAVCRDPVRLEK